MEDTKRTQRQNQRKTERKNSKGHKEQHKVQLLSAVLLVVVGCGLLVWGFATPPQGIIDGSVLIAFGEILTFVGALFGIDYHYKFKLHH